LNFRRYKTCERTTLVRIVHSIRELRGMFSFILTFSVDLIFICLYIKDGTAGKVNILGGDGIGHFERKSSYELGSHSEFLLRESCLNL
jgi:hypothetical protein